MSDEMTNERDNLKFRLWLQDRYIVGSGDKYQINHEDLDELTNGIKVMPEWELLPIWQAMMKGDYWH